MNNQKRRLKISWVSNAPFSQSGYGQATYDIERKMVEYGYGTDNFSLVNFYGQAGGKFQDELGIWNYPVVNHAFGSDAALWHSKDFKADVTLTLQDIWPLNPQDVQQFTRFIPWLPVDHDPIPAGVVNMCRFADRIIAMSKFGQEQLASKGFSSTYIPHMVDTKVFYPMNTQQIKQARGIPPDVYMFGMVAANKDNPPRKSFQEVLDAFLMFLQKVPKSMLYIHSDPNFPGGFPIAEYAKFLGIQNNVFFPGLQFPEIYAFKYNTGKKEMAQIYNTFDCLLAPSTSEGFNVPIIEAQACGIPVITSDWVAMKELVQDGVNGYKVKASGYKWTSMQSYAATPLVSDLFDKMMMVYQADRGKMKKAAHEFASKNYDLDKTFKAKWIPFFDRIEKEVYGAVIDKPQEIPQNIKAEQASA